MTLLYKNNQNGKSYKSEDTLKLRGKTMEFEYKKC